jgi:hypothetical protein
MSERDPIINAELTRQREQAQHRDVYGEQNSMKAITLKQPWAFAIFKLGKSVENRDWDTRFRGLIAIHTSKKVSRADFALSCAAIAHIVGDPNQVPDQVALPHGQIVGTVEIVDCVSASDSPWFFGEYGFVLANPTPLKNPIAASGALGLWDLPETIAEEILRELNA